MNQYPDFDQKLYDDLRRGKEYAFAAVFDRYHRLLYTIAYRFLKSEEEAEDAVQYLFMKLWEQRETFSFESGIRSLLFTILKNYILNELYHILISLSTIVIIIAQSSTSHPSNATSMPNGLIRSSSSA